MDVNDKDVTIEFGKVAAVALNSTCAWRAEGAARRVILANGGRSRCLRTLRRQALLGKPVFGGDQDPVAELVTLDMLGGAASLSDLKPAKYEGSVPGRTPWPYVADSTAEASACRSTYDKGWACTRKPG